jgi:hypothetical protein
VRTEGVPDDGVVLVRDQQQSNGVSVLRPAELVIDECDVETELAEVLRLELPGLELDHDVPELFDVEEEQVDVEVISVEGEGEGEGEEVQHIRVLRDLLRQIPPLAGAPPRSSSAPPAAACAPKRGNSEELAKIREWANANGHEVSDPCDSCRSVGQEGRLVRQDAGSTPKAEGLRRMACSSPRAFHVPAPTSIAYSPGASIWLAIAR